MKAEYVQHCGDDLVVVNAARVSFDKESDWDTYTCDSKNILQDRDEKLINYLAKHNHFTPFTHCTITLRETVPIFVARQRFKHTVGFSYNEVSRRYVDDAPEFFVPDAWRSRPEGNVKQGSGEREIESVSLTVSGPTVYMSDEAYEFSYQDILDLCALWYRTALTNGVAPEQARMVLPQSMYTSYYVTGSLAAWARAYKLRIDSHAQKEIQELAKMWNELINPLFPVSWGTLTDGC